jgi:hypothetical protein
VHLMNQVEFTPKGIPLALPLVLARSSTTNLFLLGGRLLRIEITALSYHSRCLVSSQTGHS